MRSALKGPALLVALTCAVWIAVLWRWRSNQHEIDMRDAVLYLAVLPIVVFAIALAGRWAVRSALAKQAARVSVGPATTSIQGAEAGAGARADDPAVPATWHLLGAWAHTAGGTSVDDLLRAIDAGSPRPGPDDALHDEDGLPVMTARIAELDTDAIEGELQRHADALPETLQGTTLLVHSARAVRALAALAPLIDAVGRAVLLWSGHWTETTTSGAHSAAARPTAVPSDIDRVVRVLVAWPSDWDDATCAVGRSWLSERLCEPLADALPSNRWSIAAQRMSGAELCSAAQRTLEVLRREDRDDPVILIACHSDLDVDGIGALESEQRLFHSTRHPRVSMPGEGAAVVAFSALDWPADALETEPVRVGSPLQLRRSQSIETAGRASADETIGLVRQALARGGIGGDAVAKLASDADQHTPRTTELFAVTLALMPELDASDDLRLAGAVAGRLGAAAPLLALACAAAQARESGKPAVALSLADPHWRLASVLVPESFDSSAAAA